MAKKVYKQECFALQTVCRFKGGGGGGGLGKKDRGDVFEGGGLIPQCTLCTSKISYSLIEAQLLPSNTSLRHATYPHPTFTAPQVFLLSSITPGTQGLTLPVGRQVKHV